MTSETRMRGKRVHLELDRDLARVLDDTSKKFRLKTPDFMRLLLAQQLLGTQSLDNLVPKKLR